MDIVNIVLAAIVLLMQLISSIAHAQYGYGSYGGGSGSSGGGSSGGGYFENAAKKTEEKKSTRWTLEDWLAQKERIHMGDLWLARNSHSSPFESFVEARSTSITKSDGTPNATHQNMNLYGGTLAAYAGIAGLRGTYDLDSLHRSVWSGSFNIRLFGRAMQDTHINLEYGVRGYDYGNNTTDKFSPQFGGVSTNIYITKWMGLEGTYQKILPDRASSGRQIKGEESKAGLFIDFSFVRVFGHWRNELLHFEDGGTAAAREKSEGFGGGLRMYF
jgi:hypothetical protein